MAKKFVFDDKLNYLIQKITASLGLKADQSDLSELQTGLNTTNGNVAAIQDDLANVPFVYEEDEETDMDVPDIDADVLGGKYRAEDIDNLVEMDTRLRKTSFGTGIALSSTEITAEVDGYLWVRNDASHAGFAYINGNVFVGGIANGAWVVPIRKGMRLKANNVAGAYLFPFV